MREITAAWDALRYGGAMVYPLLFLGMISIVILDRAVVCYRSLRLPASLLELVETYGFSWEQFDQELLKVPVANGYRPSSA
jgi:hypothetical protein